MTEIRYPDMTGFLTVRSRSYKKLTAEIQEVTSGIGVIER